MLSYFNVELIRSVNASSNFLQRCTSTYGQTTRLGGEMNTIRYRDSIITRSVICLIGLFILCQVPASVLNYIYMYHRNHPLLYICYDISNFLILLNSAVRFAVVFSLVSLHRWSLLSGELLHIHLLQSQVPSRTSPRLFLFQSANESLSSHVESSLVETNKFAHSRPCY